MNGRPIRRLYRSRRDRMVAGVAAGIAHFFDVDPTIVRVLWVVGALIVPPMTLASALILYVALAFIIPPEPAER